MKRLIVVTVFLLALSTVSAGARTLPHSGTKLVPKDHAAAVIPDDNLPGNWIGSVNVPECGPGLGITLFSPCVASGLLVNTAHVPAPNQVKVCWSVEKKANGWYNYGCLWYPEEPQLTWVQVGESAQFQMTCNLWYATYMYAKVEYEGVWYSNSERSIRVRVTC